MKHLAALHFSFLRVWVAYGQRMLFWPKCAFSVFFKAVSNYTGLSIALTGEPKLNATEGIFSFSFLKLRPDWSVFIVLFDQLTLSLSYSSSFWHVSALRTIMLRKRLILPEMPASFMCFSKCFYFSIYICTFFKDI